MIGLLTAGLLGCAPPAAVFDTGSASPPTADPVWGAVLDPASAVVPVDTGTPPPSVTEESTPAWADSLALRCQLALSCSSTIPSDPKIPCSFEVRTGDGYTVYEGSAGVETRGRSSASFPKQQYAVELWDEDEQPLEVDLLGMGAESDWVLNGAWVDRALFRNKLSFDLFQAMGGADHYAPESAFCELTLNGSYEGIYLLAERIKRDASRVNLEGGGEVDGESFVLKLEQSEGTMPNVMGYGTWDLVYPTDDEASDEAVAEIKRWVNGWQAATLGSAPADPDTGIFAWVDLDSAVDFVILEEFAKNNDAFFLSIYLWKDRGGKIHFVPWDLDLAYGQPSYNDNENPASWIAYRPAMIDNMTLDPAFQARLAERWIELRADLITASGVLGRIDGYVATMGDAIDANFERWPIDEVAFGSYLYPVSSYEDELNRVRSFIGARVAFMDENIASY